MKFYAYHGVGEQERTIGGQYTVDVSYCLDTKAVITDILDDTVNYSDVYDAVKAEMSKQSQLLEHVAGRIFQSLTVLFPNIYDVKVKISKLHPPVEGEVKSANVTIKQKKS